jgi:hypothetical protein
MGRSESSTIWIGSKFNMRDLVNIVNENNLEEIIEIILSDSIYIEDENGFFNTNYYQSIIGDIEEIKTLEEFYCFIEELKRHGDILLYRSGESKSIVFDSYDENNQCIYNQSFIYLHERVNDLTRWGYNREGYNVSAVPLKDIDFQTIQENIEKKWKEIGFHEYTITLTNVLSVS